MTKDFEHKPEFSRTVALDRIGHADLVEEIEASAEERAALAARFGWLSMQRLTATVRLRRLKPDLIRVSGHYEAELEQPCVVTLDPVPAEPSGEFSLLYAREQPAEREEVIAPMDEDPPEPIVGGQIDIGEAVVQQLAVALDAYPRAPGAALPEEVSGGSAPEGEEPRRNPFEALAALKRGG